MQARLRCDGLALRSVIGNNQRPQLTDSGPPNPSIVNGMKSVKAHLSPEQTSFFNRSEDDARQSEGLIVVLHFVANGLYDTASAVIQLVKS